ncbi:MAG: RNA polymerase sigma factor [Armatimonadota bacterium]
MNDWFERASGGDRRATARVVDSLRPRLEKMAAYYARRCGEDADDLLQEAWMGVLEAIPALDVRIGSPRQHLLKRAKWRLLDSVKRAKVRRCAPLDEDLARCPDPAGEPERAAEVYTSEFMGQLTARQREVVDCLLAGMTWREAGDALGCTSANVAYYMRQIRTRYRTWSAEDRFSARAR